MTNPRLMGGALHTAMLGFGGAVFLTVLSIILLVIFGVGLFLGVSRVFALALLIASAVAVWRKQHAVAVVFGVAALVLLIFEPFRLTVLDAGLSLGVAP